MLGDPPRLVYDLPDPCPFDGGQAVTLLGVVEWSHVADRCSRLGCVNCEIELCWSVILAMGRGVEVLFMCCEYQ